MRPVITHIPHYALALALVVLYFWMERAERRNEAAARERGDLPEEAVAGPKAQQALGLLVGVGLITSVGALLWHSSRSELPGWSLVLTYIGVGLVAALWAAWSVPRRLPAAVAERMGRAGRVVVRSVVWLVLAWGVFFAGMLLSQGVVLPGTPH